MIDVVAVMAGPFLIALAAWLLFWLTAGPDETGVKSAAKIMGVAGLVLVSFLGVAALPSYGGGLYTLGFIAWCLMLATLLTILAALATATVAWLRNRF